MVKYDSFFESMKSFAIDTKISTADDFIGAEENEIFSLEKKVGFRFNLCLRSYLRHFGHKIEIPNFDLTKFTISNIMGAETEANKHGIRDQIMNGSLIDGWNEKPIPNCFEQICFVNYFETNHYFTFIEINNEDQILFGWDGDENSYKDRMSITSKLRGQIFTGLKYICDVRRDKEEKVLEGYRIEYYNRTKMIDIEGLKWLRIFREKYVDNNNYVMSKHKFEEEIRLIENQENRIVGLIEYGEKFEKLVKKKAA